MNDTLQQFNLWNIQKQQIHSKESNIYFKEGDIWWCSLGMNIRSEAYGKGPLFRRPILVLRKISKDACIAIPLSTQKKDGSWFCPYTLQGEENTALLYQIKMLHANRFQRKIGELDERDFSEIKKRLKEFLNL